MKLYHIIRDVLEDEIYLDPDTIRRAVRNSIEKMDLSDMIEETLTNQLDDLVNDTVTEIIDDVIENALNDIDL